MWHWETGASLLFRSWFVSLDIQSKVPTKRSIPSFKKIQELSQPEHNAKDDFSWRWPRKHLPKNPLQQEGFYSSIWENFLKFPTKAEISVSIVSLVLANLTQLSFLIQCVICPFFSDMDFLYFHFCCFLFFFVPLYFYISNFLIIVVKKHKHSLFLLIVRWVCLISFILFCSLMLKLMITLLHCCQL